MSQQSKTMHEDHKIYHAGKARQEELDEIDRCRLCEILPELAKACYATEYCYRQMKMEFDRKDDF